MDFKIKQVLTDHNTATCVLHNFVARNGLQELFRQFLLSESFAVSNTKWADARKLAQAQEKYAEVILGRGETTSE